MSLICVGDRVFWGDVDGPEDTVMSIDGGEATLREAGSRPLYTLRIAKIEPRHVARWLRSRSCNNVPEVVAWVQEEPTERKPQLIRLLHDKIICDASVQMAILAALPGVSYDWDNTLRVAEEVVRYLLSGELV